MPSIDDQQPLIDLALSRAVVDRDADHRGDPEWLARQWAATGRVLVVHDGQVPVDDDGRLVLLPATQVPLSVSDGAASPGVVVAYLGRMGETTYFAALDLHAGGLAASAATTADGSGVDDGAAASSVVREFPGVAAGHVRWAGLRDVGAVLDDLEAGLVVHAVALAAWHRSHTHCPRCGAPTEPVLAGTVRRCPKDATEHYPRTDPAVIMTVVDESDRLLLGRQASWPERRFSTLAGFVEPGESLERAVAREVAEEVGLTVREVRYVGSQPWPFPSSLMLGFVARVEGEEPRVDGVEIAEARWFDHGELEAALASGELRLPPSISIARRLIEAWAGDPLAADGTWR